MNMAISIDSRIGQPHQGNFTSEDINIIYAALLNYNKHFADRGRNNQTGNLMSRYKTGERINKLAEVFRRCGGEADAICTY